MADRQVDFLLIGGGLAAANCARWLRESGAEGSVMVVGREPHPPYNRPPCSKGYMTATETVDDCLFRPYEWWGDQGIELLTGTSAVKLAGALSVGRSDDLDHARRLMTEKTDASDRLRELADLDFDLEGL